MEFNYEYKNTKSTLKKSRRKMKKGRYQEEYINTETD